LSTVERGTSAETRAARLLAASGYRIVERNFRCKLGELDIIARDGEILVFVEVRSRADAEHGSALDMIGPRKRARVARVAAFYLEAMRPSYERCRFDVVGITGGDAILIKDAFRL
jgi:putative endonuclease